MKILLVLSSCDRVPGSDRRTGTWFEELAAPYYAFTDAKADVVLASVLGGSAPIDPASESANAQTEATKRFTDDSVAQRALMNTIKLSAVKPGEFDAIFYCGGLGPVFDLVDNTTSIALIEETYRLGKPVAAVCHGVAALRNVRSAKGVPLIRGLAVTGFSNSEEKAAHGVGVVPFLIEDELRKLGGVYTSADDWHPHVVQDQRIITGQNPASSMLAARQLLELLK
jgi:putative intracellular protease/amidase